MNKEIIVLIAFAFFGFLAIFSFIQAQSYTKTTSSTPTYEGNQCSPDQALYAWIWSLPPTGVCPPYVNNLIVGSNGVLYQKSFVSDTDTGCCYFSDKNPVEVLLPGILIGMIDKSTPTINDLNEKPYSTVNNYIKYIVPVCDTNAYCVEYSLVSRAGSKGTYKVVKFQDPAAADTQSINEVQSAELIVTNISGKYTLQQVYVGGKLVYPSNSQNPQTTSQGIQDIISTFPNAIFPIPGTRPS